MCIQIIVTRLCFCVCPHLQGLDDFHKDLHYLQNNLTSPDIIANTVRSFVYPNSLTNTMRNFDTLSDLDVSSTA